MSVETVTFEGCKEIDDVANMLLQMIADLKAGKSLSAEILGNLGALVELVPEIKAIPDEIHTQLESVVLSTAHFASKLALVLLGKGV